MCSSFSLVICHLFLHFLCHTSTEQAVTAAIKLGVEISNAAPLAVRTCMRTLRMQQDEGLDRSLWREADAQAQVWNSADMTKGLDALVAKKKPNFGNYEALTE